MSSGDHGCRAEGCAVRRSAAQDVPGVISASIDAKARPLPRNDSAADAVALNLAHTTQRARDASGKLGFAKWLLNHDGIWAVRVNPRRIASDEEMRNRSQAENFIDGLQAAALPEAHIDNHQIGTVARGRANRAGLAALNVAAIAHLFEDFTEEQAD